MNTSLYKKMCDKVRIVPYKNGTFLLCTTIRKYDCYLKLKGVQTTILCVSFEHAVKLRRKYWFEHYTQYLRRSKIRNRYLKIRKIIRIILFN